MIKNNVQEKVESPQESMQVVPLCTGDNSPTFFNKKYQEAYHAINIGGITEAREKFVIPTKIRELAQKGKIRIYPLTPESHYGIYLNQGKLLGTEDPFFSVSASRSFDAHGEQFIHDVLLPAAATRPEIWNDTTGKKLSEFIQDMIFLEQAPSMRQNLRARWGTELMDLFINPLRDGNLESKLSFQLWGWGRFLAQPQNEGFNRESGLFPTYSEKQHLTFINGSSKPETIIRDRDLETQGPFARFNPDAGDLIGKNLHLPKNTRLLGDTGVVSGYTLVDKEGKELLWFKNHPFYRQELKSLKDIPVGAWIRIFRIVQTPGDNIIYRLVDSENNTINEWREGVEIKGVDKKGKLIVTPNVNAPPQFIKDLALDNRAISAKTPLVWRLEIVDGVETLVSRPFGNAQPLPPVLGEGPRKANPMDLELTHMRRIEKAAMLQFLNEEGRKLYYEREGRKIGLQHFRLGTGLPKEVQVQFLGFLNTSARSVMDDITEFEWVTPAEKDYLFRLTMVLRWMAQTSERLEIERAGRLYRPGMSLDDYLRADSEKDLELMKEINRIDGEHEQKARQLRDLMNQKSQEDGKVQSSINALQDGQ